MIYVQYDISFIHSFNYSFVHLSFEQIFNKGLLCTKHRCTGNRVLNKITWFINLQATD